MNARVWLLLVTLALLLTAGTASAQIRDHQKISATAGGFGGSLDVDDRFGWFLAGLGDVNGDGVPDLAVGAPHDDDGGTDHGAVWILFLGADGSVQDYTKISDTQGGIGVTLRDSDEFGHSVASVGDMDFDGVPDLAVGANLRDDGGTNRGALWILFLRPDGTVKAQQKISDTAGGFTGTLHDGDQFGHGLGGLGDLDGDGLLDIVAGADRFAGPGTEVGGMWVLFLNGDGTVRAQQQIDESHGGFTGQLHDFDLFGHDLRPIGDLDGDGVLDVVSGAPQTDDGGPDRGAFWVLFLNPDGTVKAQQKISDTAGGFTGDLDDGDFFGHPPVSAGDLDGDGVTDLLAGNLYDDDGGNDRGAFFILYMNPDGTVKDYDKVSDTVGGFTGVLDDSDLFSHALATLGDLDGDGNTDFAAGAPFDDDGGSGIGAVWVLFGTQGSTPGTCDNDGVCEGGENCDTCPNDCAGTIGGAVCGNGICEGGNGENCENCAADCRSRTTPTPVCCGDGGGLGGVTCGAEPKCEAGGYQCTDVPVGPGSFCCGDLVCDSAEDCGNCGLDCTLGPEVCLGGVDEDCDGAVDCSDGDCTDDPSCTMCGLREAPCTLDTDCCSGECHNGRGQCQ